MSSRTGHEPVAASQWLEERQWFREHRHELAPIASALYGDGTRVAGTQLLSRQTWLPRSPVDLDEVRLVWGSDARTRVDGSAPETSGVRPLDQSGTVYSTYTKAMADLARPAVFENRWVYRVTGVELTGPTPSLTFVRGHYFDAVDVGEAVGHELAARQRRSSEPVNMGELPLRTAIGDPCELGDRPTTLAVSMLTIRHDRARNRASCALHWRDPAKVAHAGGLHQVLPVGVFQPSHDSDESELYDFDLWKCIVREYAEELLGEPEMSSRSVDYDSWPLFARMTEARSEQRLRIRCLGLGVDPVTFAVDLLAVAVFDSELYDDLFARVVDTNDEGDVHSVFFDAEHLDPFLRGQMPMQPAGQAALSLAWAHRSELLDGSAMR